MSALAAEVQVSVNEADVEAAFKTKLEPVIERAAQAAFARYNETVLPGQTPWKTWDGKDVPRWEGLNDSVRAKWRASVEAMIDSVHADLGGDL